MAILVMRLVQPVSAVDELSKALTTLAHGLYSKGHDA